ncbi:amidohydrolase 2 [Cryphonectria parasitica EP155]|uniref:Amidohydrolase 2 n=1 Tax=Cryphonectria parasitica (strain ATCC 38755 / EP155) TaxID=660469 RepID=A0A9P5CK23_CRYP1|nr:amidohydrolase 2 [Cryphonectria parasitica EP155]KAF3760727.1 amidohydrolase 2 [Cryphonectria parasitica EP155]
MTPSRSTSTTTKDPGWLDFHPAPSKPSFRLPPGAVDAHCHVFGPAHLFPYAPERKYTPCDASASQLSALRDHLGFSRNVIVQATCHGTDNAALVDALRSSGGRARGVASVRREVSDEALDELHEAGVRGVRFNFVRRLVGGGGGGGFGSKLDEVREVAARIHRLGWHVVVYFEAADLPALEPLLRSLPTPVVVDHMGTPDVRAAVDGPAFARFRQLVRDVPRVYVKVTCPERLSWSGPPALGVERAAYRDVVPFARVLVEEFPDRVLWGTDWPHPNLKKHMPDDGLLVDFIPSIALREEVQKKLLVDNPVRLYWPEDV